MPQSASTAMMLLTDGAIIVQGNAAAWYRLTPDLSGSYINGTWTAIASMLTPRMDFASQVLPSGRVWVAGGEYAGPSLPYYWAGTGEIYDPVGDSWSPVANFPNQSGCEFLNTFGGNVTKNSPAVTGMVSTGDFLPVGFQPGWTVAGAGIPANTTILSVDSDSQIHLSQNATRGGARGLQFTVPSSGNTTNNSAIITGIPFTAGLQVGWDVSGNGIPASATITSIDSPTQIPYFRAGDRGGKRGGADLWRGASADFLSRRLPQHPSAGRENPGRQHLQ